MQEAECRCLFVLCFVGFGREVLTRTLCVSFVPGEYIPSHSRGPSHTDYSSGRLEQPRAAHYRQAGRQAGKLSVIDSSNSTNSRTRPQSVRFNGSVRNVAAALLWLSFASVICLRLPHFSISRVVLQFIQGGKVASSVGESDT